MTAIPPRPQEAENPRPNLLKNHESGECLTAVILAAMSESVASATEVDNRDGCSSLRENTRAPAESTLSSRSKGSWDFAPMDCIMAYFAAPDSGSRLSREFSGASFLQLPSFGRLKLIRGASGSYSKPTLFLSAVNTPTCRPFIQTLSLSPFFMTSRIPPAKLSH